MKRERRLFSAYEMELLAQNPYTYHVWQGNCCLQQSSSAVSGNGTSAARMYSRYSRAWDMIPSLSDTPERTVSHKTCEEWLKLAFPLQMAIQAGGSRN